MGIPPLLIRTLADTPRKTEQNYNTVNCRIAETFQHESQQAIQFLSEEIIPDRAASLFWGTGHENMRC